MFSVILSQEELLAQSFVFILCNSGSKCMWVEHRLRICLQYRRRSFDPRVRRPPWRRARQPTPAFLPAEFHGQRSLAGYSPWGYKESDRIERMSSNIRAYHSHPKISTVIQLQFTARTCGQLGDVRLWRRSASLPDPPASAPWAPDGRESVGTVGPTGPSLQVLTQHQGRESGK